jgi:hypothetical protein
MAAKAASNASARRKPTRNRDARCGALGRLVRQAVERVASAGRDAAKHV